MGLGDGEKDERRRETARDGSHVNEVIGDSGTKDFKPLELSRR